VLTYLAESRDSLDGVVFTGGEPTGNPRLKELLREVRSLGLAIRLDTNGVEHEVLGKLISAELVDFVALDVKAIPQRYDRVVGLAGAWQRVSASIDIVLHSGVDHEFRSTCYPYAITPAEMPQVASMLAGGRRYTLQQFRPLRTLDPAAARVAPYPNETLRRAALCCSVHIPTVVRES
jgi:pyruvate formate lyase activating enzyme